MTLVSHAKTPRVVSRALLLAAVVTAREPSDTSTIHVNATGAWGSPADRFTVPVFVKLHKVGSTTIFELFECLQHITDLLPPLGDVFPPAAALGALLVDSDELLVQGWSYVLFPCVAGTAFLWCLVGICRCQKRNIGRIPLRSEI